MVVKVIVQLSLYIGKPATKGIFQIPQLHSEGMKHSPVSYLMTFQSSSEKLTRSPPASGLMNLGTFHHLFDIADIIQHLVRVGREPVR